MTSEPHAANSTKQLGLLIGAIALYFILSALPIPEGLSDTAFKGIVITICAVVVWALDVLPVSVASIFFTLLPAVLHVLPMPKILGYFATPSIFFVFGMFLITISFQNSGVSRRIVLWTTLKSGGALNAFFC